MVVVAATVFDPLGQNLKLRADQGSRQVVEPLLPACKSFMQYGVLALVMLITARHDDSARDQVRVISYRNSAFSGIDHLI